MRFVKASLEINRHRRTGRHLPCPPSTPTSAIQASDDLSSHGILRKGYQAGMQTKGRCSKSKGTAAFTLVPFIVGLTTSPQYLDPIIAATYSDDGALQDVCRALTPRFKEPNAIVSRSPQLGTATALLILHRDPPPQIVFKALIVLHTMIRNGATDNVLSHLSQSDILRLRNVTNGQWEGEATLPSLIFSGLLTPRPCRKVTRHRRTWPTTRCTWTTGYERTET